MQILLDECLPRKLKFELKNHWIKTVPEMGWAGKSNGELLILATGKFDAFITSDQNLIYQQNLKVIEIAIVILISKSNRFAALKPLMPKVSEVLNNIHSGDVVSVSL